MLQKITVKRIAVDFYSISISEFENGRWEPIGGPAGQWPELDLNSQQQKHNPRTRLNKDNSSYTYYACVDSFPNPESIGKGWINSQGEELPDKNRVLYGGW